MLKRFCFGSTLQKRDYYSGRCVCKEDYEWVHLKDNAKVCKRPCDENAGEVREHFIICIVNIL